MEDQVLTRKGHLLLPLSSKSSSLIAPGRAWRGQCRQRRSFTLSLVFAPYKTPSTENMASSSAAKKQYFCGHCDSDLHSGPDSTHRGLVAMSRRIATLQSRVQQIMHQVCRDLSTTSTFIAYSRGPIERSFMMEAVRARRVLDPLQDYGNEA